MSNAIPQPKKAILIPRRFRVRQPVLPTTSSNTADEESASSVNASAYMSRWTRGSVDSSFIDGELGSTLGRLMRGAGRLVIDPIDNLIGFRELEKIHKYLVDLNFDEWLNLESHFDAESYAPRLVEVLRYPVYPRKLRSLAQRITIDLAVIGKVRFHQVQPRIHFYSKDEFEESIQDLCAASLDILPQRTLLSLIPVTDDPEDFLSSLRRHIGESKREGSWLHYGEMMNRLSRNSAVQSHWEVADQLPQTMTVTKELLSVLHDATSFNRIGDEDQDHSTSTDTQELGSVELNEMKLENKAEELASEGIEDEKTDLFKDPSQTLDTDSPDSTYRIQNRRKKKKSLLLPQDTRRPLGPNVETLDVTSDSAVELENRDPREKAEVLQRKVVEGKKRLLGEDHPEVLQSISQLASFYTIQHRYEEAAEMYLKLVEARRRVLGEDNHDTLESSENLVMTYWNLRRWKEAEELQLKVVDARKRLLGEDHLETLNSISNLAITYLNQGDLMGAEKLGENVVEAKKRLLGEDDPDALRSIGQLASVYTIEHRYEDAAGQYLKLVEARRRLLGDDHEETLESTEDLVMTYWNLHRWGEAEKLQLKVVDARKRLLGEDHPTTLNSISNLARTYIKQGSLKEAEMLDEFVMQAKRRILGEDHPEAMQSVSQLASVYAMQNRHEEAAEQYLKLVEARRRLLGEDHPDTLESTEDLAMTYWDLNRWKEAEELQLKVADARKRLLGEDHPKTMNSISNLAVTYLNRGGEREAEG